MINIFEMGAELRIIEVDTARHFLTTLCTTKLDLVKHSYLKNYRFELKKSFCVAYYLLLLFKES